MVLTAVKHQESHHSSAGQGHTDLAPTAVCTQPMILVLEYDCGIISLDFNTRLEPYLVLSH